MIDFNKHNWSILEELVKDSSLFKQIKFESIIDDDYGVCWRIKEDFPNKSFIMLRSKLSLNRFTIEDPYGIIGLSLINPQIKDVFLTEGVSDYFSVKLMYPNYNVLGLTTLSGNSTAKAIIVNLFDKFIICSDNDFNAVRNTGLNNAYNLKSFLQSYNKQVLIKLPETPYKDMSDMFIGKLKLSNC